MLARARARPDRSRRPRALFSRDDAQTVIACAADYIWHSMRKFDGNPCLIDNHPINCGCAWCN